VCLLEPFLAHSIQSGAIALSTCTTTRELESLSNFVLDSVRPADTVKDTDFACLSPRFSCYSHIIAGIFTLNSACSLPVLKAVAVSLPDGMYPHGTLRFVGVVFFCLTLFRLLKGLELFWNKLIRDPYLGSCLGFLLGSIFSLGRLFFFFLILS